MKAKQVKAGGFPARSGCKETTAKNGDRVGMKIITGWNVSKKRGFITFVACPNRDLYEHVSTKTGEVKAIKDGWERWTATVEQDHPNHFEKQRYTVSCYYKVKENKLYFIDQRLVASPRGNYYGSCVNKTLTSGQRAKNDYYQQYVPAGNNYDYQRADRGQRLSESRSYGRFDDRNHQGRGQRW